MENKDQNSAVPDGQTLGELSVSPDDMFDGGVVKEPPLDTNALSLEPGVPEPLTSQEQPKRQANAFLRFVRRADVILVGLLLIGVVGFIFTTTQNKQRSNETSSQSTADRFGTIEIPLNDLISGKNLTLAGAANVTINGPIQLNDSLLLAPSLQPTGAKAGQIYYDQTTNQLAYFNGSNFVFLTGQSPAGGGVQSLGGATGLLAVGPGLSMLGSQLTNSGVLSVQGQSGPVTFTAGPGIVINGTNFSNSGVLSVSSDDPDISVMSDGAGNVKLSVTGAGTGTVASSGGSAGYLPVFTASQNIEDSIVTQSGLTVTISGDLSVVTGGLTLSNALTVSNGGTGATSLAANGVLVGQGTAPVTSITAGGVGLCLLSTAGAPTWAACPSGSGVSSLNGLTGGLSIANASGAGTTITIDDASTVNKGIASFNGTNFSVASGAVNTVQNINTGATPTFAGLNTNSITPSAALTVGSISQTALLQGTTTTITSNGAGNDIVLNSADTIELQDNTNITGNLDISGTIAIGTGNAFQVDASGTLTSLSTATFQGGSLTIGAAAQAGSLVMHDGSANTGTLQIAALGQNTVYTLPDPGAGSATICLSTGNCAGTGGGVTTAGGTTNRLAKFSGAQAIADSTISDDGTNVTTSVDLIIQGGDVTVGVAASQTGSINLAHSGSSFLGTFLQGALTANRTYTLPDASGTICLSSGNCSGSGSANTLQAAYDAGNTIATTDSRDIAFTLANTTADSNFTVTIDSGSTGFVAISRANGAGAVDPAQLLLVQNVDTDRAQPVGISVQAATGGGMTTGIDVSDADITDAINVGANNIVGTTGNIDLTNFDVVGSTGTITTAGDIAVNGGDITSSGALNITPGGTLTVGVAGQQLILQGDANTQLTATGSGFTTTVGFSGTPTDNVTYNFDRSAGAGTYTICTTIGNCAGTGGGVTTSGGTTGTIAVFTGSQTLGDSLLSQSGSVVTVNGNLNLVSGNEFQVNGTQISSANLSNDANLAKLGSSQTFTGATVAFQNGANSTNAFNVQNAAGTRILTVDTTNAQVVLGVGSSLDGSIVFNNMSNANTVTILPGTPTADRTITLPDASGVICTDSGNCAGAGATLQTAYNFSVGGTTPKIKLNSTLLGFDIQDADTTIGANLLNIRESNGAGLGSVMFGVGNTGAVTLQNSSNSTAALRLLTSGGTNVLTGDTTNGRIILGQSSTLTGTLVFNNSSNTNTVTLTSAAATGSQTITLPDASGTVCLTSGNCTGAGSSNTLQAAYDAGNTITATTGRDVLVTLADLASDPNFIINLQCDTACGSNGRFALQDDGVDTFTVSPAGGAIAIQPTTDTTTAFNMKTSLGNNIFTIDSLNSQLGFNLGASNLPSLAGTGGFELKGALKLSGAGGSYADEYVTPLGDTIGTMVNILNYDPGAFNQLIALGLPSAADTNSRAITLLDARAGSHQPTLAVVSPNENEIGGFSWDGSNSDFRVKNSAAGSISLNVFGTDRLSASTTGVTVNGALTQSGGAVSLTGNNTSSISTTSGTLTLQSVNGSNNIVINGGSNAMTLNTGTSGTITVGSSNTSTVNIGAQTNNVRTVNVGYSGASSQAQTVNIGATASTGTTSIYSGTGGTIISSTGSTTVRQSGTATTTAFQVQNVAGTATYFNVDALNGRVGVGTAAPNAQFDVIGQLPTATAGSVLATDLVYDVEVMGKYAYTANYGDIQIWDITRPAAPVSLGTADITSGISGLKVSGHYVFAWNSTWEEMYVIDVANPAAPSVLTTMPVTGIGDLAVQGRYLYVATSDTNGSVLTYDISNPGNPTLVSTLSQSPRSSGRIVVQGDYAYVAQTNGFTNYLQVVDISNPASPANLGLLTVTAFGDLYVSGRYVYIAGGTTLQAINVSNPSSPASAGSVTTGSSPSDVVVQGRYAYLALDTDNQIQVINVSNPASMTSVGTVAAGGELRSLAVQGRYVYAGDYTNERLKVFDMGGGYIQQLEAGGLQVMTADISSMLNVSGSAAFSNGIRVNGGAAVTGDLGIYGSQLIQTANNTTEAFKVLDSAGTTTVFDVDTTNKRVGIGTNTPTRTLDVSINTSATNALPLLLQQAGSGDVGLEIKNASASFYAGIDSSDSNKFKITSDSAGGSDTMGYTSVGASVDGGDADNINATKFTANSTGSVSTIRAYVASPIDTAPNNQGQVAIYTDSSGSPGTLLGNSNGTDLTGDSWVEFTLTSPVNVTSGQVYWIGYNTNATSVGENNLVYDAGATNQVRWVSQTYGTWPGTWSGGTYSNTQFSIYAVIDVDAGSDNLNNSLFELSTNGQATFQNNSDSTNAFRILNSDGTNTVLNADTTNGRVGIGTDSPTRTLDVSINTSATSALPLLLQQSGSGDTGLELKTSTRNYYVGVDNTDGSFKISSGTSANGTFTEGNTGVPSGDDFNTNGAQARKITASASGTVSSMSVYITSLDGTPANRMIQVGIYSDNGSGTSPNALLASSTPQTAVVGWNTISLTGVSITAGTVYWIAMAENGANWFASDGSGSTTAYHITDGYPLPDPFAANVGNSSENPAFYITVTNSGSSDNFGGTNMVTISDSGQTTFQNATDSTSAFRILNAADMPQFVVDTDASMVYVGDPNGVGSTDLTVQGDATVSGLINAGTFSGAGLTDCDASNSKLLYDATTDLFSCGTDRASFTVYKPADETVSSSTTLQDDDHFQFSIGANETWSYQIYAAVKSNATADWQYDITAPAGSTCRVDANDLYDVINNWSDVCNSPTVSTMSDNLDHAFLIYGTVTSGGTAGTVKLRWAQGTSNAVSTLVRRGSHMVAYKMTGADLAEAYYTKDNSIAPGDIVRVDGSLTAGVQKSQGTYDSQALGIVSTQPGMVLGDPGYMSAGNKPVLLALSGRIPVKVSLENGPIQPGDYLTTSSTPGVAMKATKPGQMIGKAIEGFSSENPDAMGTVMTFANLTWADPTSGTTANNELQGSSFTDINATGTVTTQNLVVTNKAEVNELVVGSMTANSISVSGDADVAGDINLQGVGLSRNAITKRFKASKAISIGAVVIADPDNDGQVTTTTLAADTRVLGVALTEAKNAGDEIKVAIGGSVQVKVVPGAPITGGDLLVSSSAEGAAEKTVDLQAGSLIGKSLGKPSEDMTWVLISLQ